MGTKVALLFFMVYRRHLLSLDTRREGITHFIEQGDNYLSTIKSGGRSFVQGNRWFSPPASMTSRLASVSFPMASKLFIEEKDKNFEFIREILFRFLGFGDFKVPIVIEN